MPIQIVVSDDMWNEKKHSQQVSAYDDVQVYAHFDQAISHELEYIEKDITHFWLEVTHQGALIATLKTNKILPELMDEAKQFKNGKFKFPLCSLPSALSQSYQAEKSHLGQLRHAWQSRYEAWHKQYNSFQQKFIKATLSDATMEQLLLALGAEAQPNAQGNVVYDWETLRRELQILHDYRVQSAAQK